MTATTVIHLKDGSVERIVEDDELTLGKLIATKLGAEPASIYYRLMAERDCLAISAGHPEE